MKKSGLLEFTKSIRYFGFREEPETDTDPKKIHR